MTNAQVLLLGGAAMAFVILMAGLIPWLGRPEGLFGRRRRRDPLPAPAPPPPKSPLSDAERLRRLDYTKRVAHHTGRRLPMSPPRGSPVQPPARGATPLRAGATPARSWHGPREEDHTGFGDWPHIPTRLPDPLPALPAAIVSGGGGDFAGGGASASWDSGSSSSSDSGSSDSSSSSSGGSND